MDLLSKFYFNYSKLIKTIKIYLLLAGPGDFLFPDRGLERHKEHRHAAQQQPLSALHMREVAVMRAAELEVEGADVLLELFR